MLGVQLSQVNSSQLQLLKNLDCECEFDPFYVYSFMRSWIFGRTWKGRLPVGARLREPFSRCASLRAHSILHSPSHEVPNDVDPDTGLCAGGQVRIAHAPGKGLGAFAEAPLPAAVALGSYAGEVLTIESMHMRYGNERPGGDWHSCWLEEQCRFRSERSRRGVSTTGRYIFKYGTHASSGLLLLIDAEDPDFANWTRFLNHSSNQPNLKVEKSLSERNEPVIGFVTARAIEMGEELLFDYGPNYFGGSLDAPVEQGRQRIDTGDIVDTTRSGTVLR